MSKKNEHLAGPKHKNLVLASTSSYRAALLGRLGMPFTTLDPKVDETALPNETPKALALRLAIAKAQTPLAPGSAWILGSDQVLTW